MERHSICSPTGGCRFWSFGISSGWNGMSLPEIVWKCNYDAIHNGTCIRSRCRWCFHRIPNRHHDGKGNGLPEGPNGMIQMTKCIGRGYPNTDNFITMVFFRHGRPDIRSPVPHPRYVAFFFAAAKAVAPTGRREQGPVPLRRRSRLPVRPCRPEGPCGDRPISRRRVHRGINQHRFPKNHLYSFNDVLYVIQIDIRLLYGRMV